MKKRFQRVDSISLRVLLSYFSILLVPLLVIAILYGASMDAILASRQETAHSALEKSALNLSARIEELHNISSYIYTSSSINAVINRSRFETQSRNISTVQQAIDALPSYKLTNQMIDDVFIFFSRAQFIIKQPNAFADTRANYDAHVAFRGLSYDRFKELTLAGYNGNLLVTTGDGDARDVLLMRSIPYGTSPEALIVIRLSTAEIESILDMNDTGPGGAALVLGADGALMAGTGRPLTEAETATLAESTADEIALGGERYLLCAARERGLTFLTLTRKAFLLESLAPIKTLMMALGTVAILLGTLICLTLWRGRRRVVRSITDTARSVGVDFEPVRSESHLLETTVSALASTVDTLRETMDHQHHTLSQTVVQGCLNGTFPTRQDMLREVSALALDLSAAQYHVVRVLLLAPGEHLPGAAQMLPYRIFLKQFFDENLRIPHIACDLDGASFALLLTEQAPLSTQALVQRFRALSDLVGQRDWAVPSFAISDGTDDLWRISTCNAQTDEITRYMTLLSRSGVFAAGDLPAATDAMAFPMETEIHLIQAMKGGSPEALAALFDRVMEDNLARRALDTAMLGKLLDALRRSILRAVEETMDPADLRETAGQLESVRSFAGLRSHAALLQERLFHASEKQTRAENEALRKQLQALIDENLSNPLLSLYMLSEMVGTSESALYRTFKDCFGLSFSGYLEQCRINRAFELLKANTLVKDVAAQVGYTSDHTFRRAFKRVMKVPPGQFAKLSQ